MVLGEFDGDEAGHGRFALEAEERPDAFEQGAEPVGGARPDPAGDGLFAGAHEQAVDELPELHRFDLREEVGLAVGPAGEERVEGAEVRVGRRVDVRDVDPVLAVADDAEPSGAGAGEDAREKMMVARPPDEVRSERADLEPVRSRLERDLFGDGLRLGIGAEPVVAVRQRFVGAAEGFAVEDDARGARVDEGAHAVGLAGGDDVRRPVDVDADVLFPRAPDAGLRRHVEDVVAPLDRGVDRRAVGDVAAMEFDLGREFAGERGAAEHADAVAAGEAAADDGLAEEAGAAGDEDEGRVHRTRRRVHSLASRRRWILAL